MKLLLSCLLLTMIVGGCSEAKKENVKKTTTCLYSDNFDEFVESKMVFVEKDGKLVELYETVETDKRLASDVHIQAFTAMLDDNVDTYKSADEFSYEYEEKTENVFVEHLKYNTKDFEPEELLSDAMLNSDGKYTLKNAIKVLEGEGYTCKTK